MGSNDDFLNLDNYTIPIYEPSAEVKQLHGFYHHGSDEFDPSDSEYQLSIVGFWLATVVIGFVILLFAWILGLCSFCSCFQRNCLKCCIFSGKHGRLGVALMLLSSAVVITGSYLGYTSLVDASEGLGEVLQEAADIFKVIEDSAYNLYLLEYDFDDAIKAMDCPAVLNVSDLDAYDTAADALYALTDGFSAKIESKTTILTETLPESLGMGIGFIVVAYWVLALLGLISIKTTCIAGDIIFSILVSVVMLGFIVFLGFELMFAVGIADFCYAGPLDSLNTLAVSALGGNQSEIITYYTQCTGTNPFVGPLRELNEALTSSAFELQNNTQTSVVCQSTGINDYLVTVNSTSDAITTIAESFSCNTINPLFAEVANEIICGDFVDGLSQLWAVQVVASVFLYMAFVGFPCATSNFAEAVFPDESNGEKAIDDGDL